MARIPLPTRETLATDELKERWDRMAARGNLLNVTRAFLTNPEIPLNALQVWTASGLDARSRELVILRAAFQKQSRYEWHQHVRIARAAGLGDAEINGVRDWQESPLFSEADRALLGYVDALAAAQRADDASFAAVSANRTAGEVFGITFLITLYFQLAQIMATFELETEDPFVGWEVG